MDIPGSLHGACTRDQALAVLGRYGLRFAVANGQLTPLWRGVLVDPARLLDPLTRAAAACIVVGPTAVLCGLTALRLHGCAEAETHPVHVITPYNRWARNQDGLRVHQGRVAAESLVTLHGLPAVALDLAVCDVLCTAPRRLALACADQAVARLPRSEQAPFIDQVAQRLHSRLDRRGTRRARGLLDLVDGAAESPPESSLRLIVVDAGFPIPVVQYEVCAPDGTVVWRLDLAWPQARVALEYDGFAAHAGREARDAARDEDLRRRGWIVVHATADDLRDPGRVLHEISAAFRRREAGAWQRRLAPTA
jgi:Protein of unknown function (DUF559)